MCKEKWGEQANMNCMHINNQLFKMKKNKKTQPDFYQLQKILQEALKNIDEEKLYTKHIFDRFDMEALICAVTSHGS